MPGNNGGHTKILTLCPQFGHFHLRVYSLLLPAVAKLKMKINIALIVEKPGIQCDPLLMMTESLASVL